MARRRILLAAVVMAGIAAAAAPATFEVASVRLSKAPDGVMFFSGGMMDSASGRLRIPNIGGNATAMHILSVQLVRFTAARASPQASQADLRIMLQALLAERFRLVTHREMKELPIYALVAAKSGPGLSPGKLLREHRGQALALALRRMAGRPVVDETGITGTFDFPLTWSPDEAATDMGPSIFTALQEQPGLRLEPRKSQVEILVVDHAQRIPTEN